MVAEIHINEGEAGACQLASRWRAKQPSMFGQRFLHVMDSQANLSNAAKGRTSSLRSRRVLLRCSAMRLASGLRDVNGYQERPQPRRHSKQ